MKEFDKVIGYEDEKYELERICDILKNPGKYRALGVVTPKGLLLEGDAGLGKTLMARCLIGASGRKAFCCRKDKPNGEFVNEIRKTFEEAKAAAPSIVFLDDMDKFANEDKMHRNAEEFVTIQSCIDDCKEEEVFVLATANEVHCLPHSLLRAGRFDKTIEIEAPKYKDAVKIVEHYLSKKQFVSDVDVEEITKILAGRSCAELETVINEAGLYAGFAGKTSIDMEDMIKACLRVIYEASETVNSELKYRDEVAYHEAGHALIQEMLEPGSVNLVSIASYNGNIGGVTSSFQNEDYFKDKTFMENRIMCLLGGRAATEIVFGTTDVGSTSDLQRTIAIVDRFVDSFCYCTYGFGLGSYSDSGINLANRRDMAIELEMQRFYNSTKRMLIENRDLLDALAQALIEKKTILRKDIAELKATRKKSA